jgi:transcriptional regulator of acetoin/glycerol metabolism
MGVPGCFSKIAFTGTGQSLRHRAAPKPPSSGGNRTRAAELLGINRRLLYDKLREHHLE